MGSLCTAGRSVLRGILLYSISIYIYMYIYMGFVACIFGATYIYIIRFIEGANLGLFIYVSIYIYTPKFTYIYI